MKRNSSPRLAGLAALAAPVALVALATMISATTATKTFAQSYEQIRQAGQTPENWLTYSGTYDSHRYSTLRQIDRTNVSRLKPAWVYQIAALHKVETVPLVADGVMYISEPPSNVTAIDTKTGRPLWKYVRRIPEDVHACCGQVNRGVAILNGRVYISTLDSHLVALDARTGAVSWDTVVSDYKAGYSGTGAPLAVKDKIIVGTAGGEFGIRGYVDAYDAKTGARAWRFWTVPAAGEPGVESWAGDSWKTGAVSSWVTGSFDPELNTLYWGLGNPGPLFDGSDRGGDNLYSNSLAALDPDTGRLKWYFQFTPHDTHDWDSTQIPVLVDSAIAGQPRKLVLFANRNGFYYVIDRVTGKFVTAKAYVRQTWAKGIDANGRPIVQAATEPTPEGTVTFPSVGGGSNYFSPSYSPATKLFYVSARDAGSVFHKSETPYQRGSLFVGGSFRSVPKEEEKGAVRALNPTTGDLAWEFPLFSAPWSGVLSTAGGLVISGTNEGEVFALDDRSGKLLWHFQTGGASLGNPITYSVDGKQYIATTNGNAVYAFAID